MSGHAMVSEPGCIAVPLSSRIPTQDDVYVGEHLGRVRCYKYVPFDLNKAKHDAPQRIVQARLTTYLDIYRDPHSRSRIGCLLRLFLKVPVGAHSTTTVSIGRLDSWMVLKPTPSQMCEDLPHPGLWVKEWVTRGLRGMDGLSREMLLSLKALFQKPSGQPIRSGPEDDGTVRERSHGPHEGDNLIYIQVLQIEEPSPNPLNIKIAGQGLMKHVLELYRKSFTSPIFQNQFSLFGPTTMVLEPGVLLNDSAEAYWNARAPAGLTRDQQDDWIIEQLIAIYRHSGFEVFADKALVEVKKGEWCRKIIMGQRWDFEITVPGEPSCAVTVLDSSYRAGVLNATRTPRAAMSAAIPTTPPMTPATTSYTPAPAMWGGRQSSPESEAIKDFIEVGATVVGAGPLTPSPSRNIKRSSPANQSLPSKQYAVVYDEQRTGYQPTSPDTASHLGRKRKLTEEVDEDWKPSRLYKKQRLTKRRKDWNVQEFRSEFWRLMESNHMNMDWIEQDERYKD